MVLCARRWTGFCRALLNGNNSNALNNHQRKNDQGKDDSVAEKPPREGKIVALAGDDVDQQAGAKRDDEDDGEQAQQPHRDLGRLIEPARDTGRGLRSLCEGGELPGFRVIE